jgi:hypothetical protein
MTTMPTHPSPSDDDDLSPLLSEPFAQAWAAPAPGLPGRLGERLGGRLAQSLQAEQGMVTVRRRRSQPESLADSAGSTARRPAGRRAPASPAPPASSNCRPAPR